MKTDGFYTKPLEEFKQRFFPPSPELLEVKDTRDIDVVTGEKIGE